MSVEALCGDCQLGDHSGYCCSCCPNDDGPEPPDPSDEALCESDGHPYYGDDYPDAPDGRGGRCYCGKVRYLTGGRETNESK